MFHLFCQQSFITDLYQMIWLIWYNIVGISQVSMWCGCGTRVTAKWFIYPSATWLVFSRAVVNSWGYLNGNIFGWNLQNSHKIWEFNAVWLVERTVTWLFNEISSDFLVLKGVLVVKESSLMVLKGVPVVKESFVKLKRVFPIWQRP